MKTYNLTEEEKKIFKRIDVPQCAGEFVLTKPVIVAYSLETNSVVGLSSLERWRDVMEELPEYAYSYIFELRNMW